MVALEIISFFPINREETQILKKLFISSTRSYNIKTKICCSEKWKYNVGRRGAINSLSINGKVDVRVKQ